MPPLPYIPVPTAYTADPVMVQAPLLRADVDGTLQLVLRPPMLSAVQQQSQNLATTGTFFTVNMDDELYDPYSGHTPNGANNPLYFPPLPGWYLAEASVVLQSSATTGTVVSGIQYVTNGAAAANAGGERLPNAFAAGAFSDPHPACARLVQAVLTGPNRTGTDTIASYVRQTAAANTLTNGFNINGKEGPTFGVVFAGTGAASALSPPACQAAPTPPTLLLASWLQTNVHDACSFLINPPMMERELQGTQTLASATTLPSTSAITVTLDTTIVDNYSAFNGSTNVWTAPVAGVYYVYGQVDGNTATNTQNLAAGLTVTSANYNSGTKFTWWSGAANTSSVTDDNCVAVKRLLRLNANDTISLGAFQRNSAAGSMTLNGSGGASRCRLITLWKGF